MIHLVEKTSARRDLFNELEASEGSDKLGDVTDLQRVQVINQL